MGRQRKPKSERVVKFFVGFGAFDCHADLWDAIFHVGSDTKELRELLSIKETLTKETFTNKMSGSKPWADEALAVLNYRDTFVTVEKKEQLQYVTKWFDPWEHYSGCLALFNKFIASVPTEFPQDELEKPFYSVGCEVKAYLEKVVKHCDKNKGENKEWITAGMYVLVTFFMQNGKEQIPQLHLHLPPEEYDPVSKADNTPITIPDAAMCSPGLQAEIEQRLTGHKLAPRLAGASGGFLMFDCRKTLIERAADELENNTPLLILHGLGGIGKTETAIQIGLRIHKKAPAFLVNWRKSTAQTLAELFDKPELPMDLYALAERTLQILQDEFAGSVLILDNFFREDKSLEELQNEPAFQQLRDLSPDIRLLLTTRYRGNQEWYVEPPSEDDLLKLMQRYLKNHEEKEDVLRALIDRVERHTLTVKLIAQTLEAEEGRLSGQQLLELLDTKELAQAQMSPVGDDKDRSHYHARIYGHLQKLFNHSGLNESQRQMMAIACLLPDGGMDLPLLRSALPESLDQARQQLQHRGWLDRRGALLTIHPLVAQVCMEIQEPEVIDEFLLKLCRNVSVLCKKNYEDNIKFHTQVAQTFANAALLIEPSHVWTAWYEYMTVASLLMNSPVDTEDEFLEFYEKAAKMAQRATQIAASVDGLQNKRNLSDHEKKHNVKMLEIFSDLFWVLSEHFWACECMIEAKYVREQESAIANDCDHMYSLLADAYTKRLNAKSALEYCELILRNSENLTGERVSDLVKESQICGEDPIKLYTELHVLEIIECSNTPEEKFEAAACLQHLRELGIASQWWEQALAAK